MKILRYLLFPVVPIYFLVTWLRNKLYDLGIKKTMTYDFPVICVGNLSAGGTGKTPMIEYLVKLLKDDYKLATLSRGYKRKTEGFQLADANATAETVGDEPFQFYNKFKDGIQVAVDSDRQNGIAKLQALAKKPEVILLDDAFQHRKVQAGFNVMLTTYANPFYNDIVLPTGDLREPRSGAKRANCIVVTKCPSDLKSAEKDAIVSKIKPNKEQAVFFSAIVYSDTLFSETGSITFDAINKFTLVTGIANASPLVQFLKGKQLNFEHLNYKDHHDFTDKDIKALSKKSCIVTTEKDFMRLKDYAVLKDTLYYLPIEVKIDDAVKFNDLIKGFVKR
ncbi:tetraacyldisaccharide 4'-kinase [Tamlana sp. 2_MG-2023]|uniref:tetraacyldisaccharide 4'-kinase n=1 Tax=unclassified Tamlana TaxID=2614803 RepID=UPI0026E1F578|nr:MULTISPECIES: tetraacyldisaccharide 4'-kinase [unclassified Tamlana]MDO6760292.1 tetraacyldisaccharide 4'-kinase [Tamlana sp. 2_MG-2023]MDO6790010.1 tetraacyldisaccharide 4'-kinase [Tamlana sp. 1_MG-2023]